MLNGLLLTSAVAVGSLLGVTAPGTSDIAAAATDPLILTLVTLILLSLRLDRRDLAVLRQAPRTVAVAWLFNFALVPVVAYAVGSTVMVGEDALRVGVLLYCLFPCTDWFLAFTRLAEGETRIGAALIPLNMATQLVLYPVHLQLLTGAGIGSVGAADWMNLVTWFGIPAAVAIGLRILARLGRSMTDRLRAGADALVPAVLATLVACLFITNVRTVLEHPAAFWRVLGTVFVFLAITCLLGEIVTRWLRLAYAERALVVMTTSARNAPLILGLTMAALPGQPMVYAALVLGMLVEFPHLTVLQQLLLRSRHQPEPTLGRDVEAVVPR